MKAAFAILAVLVAAGAPISEIRYFQFQRPVEAAPNASGQACVVLDAQTFADAAPDLKDLRLYRGSDETPYVVRLARPTPLPQQTIAPINLGVRSGKTVFDAVMPQGEYGDLQLNIDARDFLASVTVTGSQTDGGSATRIGSWTIFDFSSQRLGRSTVVHLPRSNFRTLHFEIAGPIAPGKVLGITAAPAPLAQPRYLSIFVSGLLMQRGRDSVLEFHLPANVPVDRIAFTPPSQPANFSRQVELQARAMAPAKQGDHEPEAPAVTIPGNLLRLHRDVEGHHIDEEHLAIDVPQTVFTLPTKWTLTIQNGDDLPIRFSSVQVQMLERNLCFETAPGASYTLYYGDKLLSAPRYDYASWFSPRADGVVATLGREQVNPIFRRRPDSRPFTEKHPALLWIALVLVILLLGLVALRSARRVEAPAKMP